MRLFRLLATDYDHEFKQFQIGRSTHRTEVWTRNIMVASCGVVLWFATGQMIMLVWGFGYVDLNTAYVGFLRQQTFPVRPVHLAVAIVASMVIVFWLGGLAVYLSSLGEGEFR